jgi:hypothetical protein
MLHNRWGGGEKTQSVLIAGRAKAQGETHMAAHDLNILFSAIAALAVLLYMAPGALRLSPRVRRITEPAAMAVIAIGIAIAALIWAFGG